MTVSPVPLTRTELVDLFKHWDTRVSHQELLFVPLSVAGIAAVAATWDKIDATGVLVTGLGSLLLYSYYVLAIRRLAVFQEKIYAKLTEQYTDWREIVQRGGRFGIQRLRLLGLPILAILWLVMLEAKLGSLSELGNSIMGRVGILLLLPAPVIIALRLWYTTTPEN